MLFLSYDLFALSKHFIWKKNEKLLFIIIIIIIIITYILRVKYIHFYYAWCMTLQDMYHLPYIASLFEELYMIKLILHAMSSLDQYHP